MSIESAIAKLQEIMGDQVTTSNAVRMEHGQNESYFKVTPPDAVVRPHSTEDVARIVQVCAAENCPVIARGVGTSLEGHALAFRGGISLDMCAMDKVLAINPDDMDAIVQPGVTREQLNAALRDTGLFFPIDPGANATLGGMAATRASGTTAVRYGTMKDNVLALEVVLGDGRVIRTGTRARKSSAGYDLTGLFVGSEGTLGVATELTLRLHGLPEAMSSAVCAFDDVESTVHTVIATIQMGVPVARIELADTSMIRALNAWDASMELPEKPHLFMEFHGTQGAIAEQEETVAELVASFGGSAFKWATTSEDRNALWRARHQAYYAAKAMRPGCRVVTTDVCVPISRLAQAIGETAAEIEASPIEGPIVGHVGDGNFHAALLIDPDSPEELKIAKDLVARMNRRALRLGGTITGEHGVGVGKMPFMAEEHGDAWSVMAEIKRAIDPGDVMNPGKVVAVN